MPARLTEKKIVAAMEESKGLAYLAARILGCAPQTVYNWIDRSDKVREVFERNRGELIDEAEQSLRDAVQDREPWAVKFTLATQGKKRGYVERQEITGADGGPVGIEVVALDYGASIKSLEPAEEGEVIEVIPSQVEDGSVADRQPSRNSQNGSSG